MVRNNSIPSSMVMLWWSIHLIKLDILLADQGVQSKHTTTKNTKCKVLILIEFSRKYKIHTLVNESLIILQTISIAETEQCETRNVDLLLLSTPEFSKLTPKHSILLDHRIYKKKHPTFMKRIHACFNLKCWMEQLNHFPFYKI